MSDSSSYIWPEIFVTGEGIAGRDKAALCSDGLCIARAPLPERFGEVMAAIGRELEITPTAEGLHEWADQWLRNGATA